MTEWGSIAGLEAYIHMSMLPFFRGSPALYEPDRNTEDGWFLIWISMPIAFHSPTRICSPCSRPLSPVVVTIVSDARTPPLLRIPSEPGTQPAWSRSCFDFAGSYDSWVRPFGEAQPCETADVPGFAFPNSSL